MLSAVFVARFVDVADLAFPVAFHKHNTRRCASHCVPLFLSVRPMSVVKELLFFLFLLFFFSWCGSPEDYIPELEHASYGNVQRLCRTWSPGQKHLDLVTIKTINPVRTLPNSKERCHGIRTPQ